MSGTPLSGCKSLEGGRDYNAAVFWWIGLIGAFDVDGWDWGSHGAEVGGELATVVCGVADGDVEVRDGGVVAEADVIELLCEAVGGELLQQGDALGGAFGVPGGEGLAGGGGFGWARVWAELAVEDGVEKPEFTDGDVAGELEGGHADGARLVLFA